MIRQKSLFNGLKGYLERSRDTHNEWSRDTNKILIKIALIPIDHVTLNKIALIHKTQFKLNKSMAVKESKKGNKAIESINSRLSLVMKSGKVNLGYKSTLKTLRNGKCTQDCTLTL